MAPSASYQHDVLNRLTQLTDSTSLAFTFANDPNSKPTTQTAPNGVTTRSLRPRCSQLSVCPGSLFRFVFSRDLIVPVQSTHVGFRLCRRRALRERRGRRKGFSRAKIFIADLGFNLFANLRIDGIVGQVFQFNI